MSGYWLVVGGWVLTIVALGVVAYQRDKAQSERQSYRTLLMKQLGGWDPLRPGYPKDIDHD